MSADTSNDRESARDEKGQSILDCHQRLLHVWKISECAENATARGQEKYNRTEITSLVNRFISVQYFFFLQTLDQFWRSAYY